MDRAVLVVEDDRDFREALAEALGEIGYVVECEQDGAAAVEHLRRTRPAAIVLDLQMPGMNGLEFLEMRRHDVALADIPVIVLSGDRRMTDRARTMSAEFVFEKPVRLLILLDAIQRVSHGAVAAEA